MGRWVRAATLAAAPAVLGLVHGACSSSDDAPVTPADGGPDVVTADAPADADAAVDAAPRRYLAASGAQLVVKGGPVGAFLRPANLVADTDLIAVHQDFYGIPWDTFGAAQTPPAAWVALIDAVVADVAAAKKGVFLSLTPLNGQRATLAPKVVADGTHVDPWAARCYDFGTAPDASTLRAAYLRYVDYMIDRFPTASYVAIGIEVNLFADQCPDAAWSALVDLLNAAYDAVKTKRPDAIVFPTLEIGHLQGYDKAFCDPANRAACFDANYAKLAKLKRDRIAMSTYPYGQGLLDPNAVPADWFRAVSARGNEKAVISETGWLTTPIVVEGNPGQCFTAASFDEAAALAWMERVLAARKAQDMDLVTWISDRDVLDGRLMTDCPCTFDSDWCALRDVFRDAGPDATVPEGGTPPWVAGELGLKAFGAMGLRQYDGTPKKTLLDRWQNELGPP